MAIEVNWSEETYVGDIYCPTCGLKTYKTATIFTSLYKKSTGCPRMSKVVDEDNLTVIEESDFTE